METYKNTVNYNTSTGTVYTTKNEYNDYSAYCWNRLPCGVCKLTNSMCPLPPHTVEITCAASSGVSK